MPYIDGKGYPGPYQLRIFYTWVYGGLNFNSVLTLNMDMDTAGDPGDPFSAWTCKSRLGAVPQLDTFTDDLVALLRPFWHTSASFTHAELWYYPGATFNAAFQSTYTIGLAGTNATATQRASQAILTFRCQLGGSARINLAGTSFGIAVTDAAPFANADVTALAAFLTDTDSPMIGRDGSYTFTALNWLAGENEAYFKKQYRP